jgi:hypothetical protein
VHSLQAVVVNTPQNLIPVTSVPPINPELRLQFEAFIRGGEVTRPSCKNCACKHLSQARAIISEKQKAPEYRHYYWFAMGHIAEAEDELVRSYPQMAAVIRAERLKLEHDPNYLISFESLVDAVTSLPDAQFGPAEKK